MRVLNAVKAQFRALLQDAELRDVLHGTEALSNTARQRLTSGPALAAMGKGSSEALHLGALDVAVEMVEAGHVLPVIEAATERWSRHVDPSHLRYFAGEVLEVAGPPYGGRFASAMVRLLRAANARPGTAGMNRTIDEFVAQVRRQREGGRLHPNLAKEDDTFLEDLAK